MRSSRRAAVATAALSLSLALPGILAGPPAAAQAAPAAGRLIAAWSPGLSAAAQVPAGSAISTRHAAGLRPARAKPARPRIAVVPAAGAVTVTWAKAAGAVRYRAEVSTSKGFDRATTTRVSTRAQTRVIGGLKNGTVAFVRVIAIGTRGQATSRVTQVTPSKARPGAVTRVRVKAAGTNRITVTWRRPARAQGVWVAASYGAGRLTPATGNSAYAWRSKALPATATSVTLAIPRALRAKVGSASGNPVVVQVFAKNAGKVARSAIAPGRPQPPRVLGAVSQRVSLATYNVHAVQYTAGRGRLDWSKRRHAVTRSIVRSRADVVAVQEASVHVTPSGLRQFEDLASLLRPHGYQLAYDPQAAIGARKRGGVVGTHLFVKTSRIQVLGSGVLLTSETSPGPWWDTPKGKAAGSRDIAWARLRSKASGRTFAVTAVHLLQGHDAATVAVRNRAIAGIEAFSLARAGGRPIALMGDFNSYVWRYPDGPDTYLLSRGWASAAATASYAGRAFPTFNDAGGGFPSRPARSYLRVAANRIDQIFLKRASGVVRYVNQVSLTPAGTYDRAYQGSDHNLQRAIVVFR